MAFLYCFCGHLSPVFELQASSLLKLLSHLLSLSDAFDDLPQPMLWHCQQQFQFAQTISVSVVCVFATIPFAGCYAAKRSRVIESFGHVTW